MCTVRTEHTPEKFLHADSLLGGVLMARCESLPAQPANFLAHLLVMQGPCSYSSALLCRVFCVMGSPAEDETLFVMGQQQQAWSHN